MIGLFDSGLGGLSILNHFHRKLSQYGFLYYGDSLNSPYGNLSNNEIYKHSKRAIEFLFSQGAVLVIVACNTVSARVLRSLQDDYFNSKFPQKKVLGIIIPNIENIIENINPNTVLGIIGTSATIESTKYQSEINKKRPDIKIYAKACPKFALLIEKDKFKSLEYFANIKEEIDFFQKLNINNLLLACTHYSFIKNDIKKSLKTSVNIIDSSNIISTKTIQYLEKHGELNIKKESLTTLYTSGNLNQFKSLASNMLLKQENRSLKFLKSPILSYD